MKNLLLTAAVVTLGFTSQPVAAQSAEANAGAVSGAQSASQSGSIAAAQGGSVSITSPARTSATVRQEQSGKERVKVQSAPALGSLALGGGHPCAYSPATIQASIIGGAFGMGGMTIDEACMLLVMASASKDPQAYNAAIYMIAARDPDACKAMYASGLVSDCVNRRGKSTIKPAGVVSSNSGGASVRPPQTVMLKVDCRRTERGTIQPVVSKAVADKYSREQIMGACK